MADKILDKMIRDSIIMVSSARETYKRKPTRDNLVKMEKETSWLHALETYRALKGEE